MDDQYDPAHDPAREAAHRAAEEAARAAVLAEIVGGGRPRRPRMRALTATLTATLVLPALVGVVLVAADPRDDTAATAARAASATTGATPDTEAVGGVDTEAAVPLRVEDADVTMSAAPTPRRQRTGPTLPAGLSIDRDLAEFLDSAQAAYDSVPLPVHPTPVTRAQVPVDASYSGNLEQVEARIAREAAAEVVDDPGPTGSPTGEGASFVVATFNVLGSSHTINGARGRASGPRRMRGAVELLRRHDVDVVGFQELQRNQVSALRRITGGSYALYPGVEGPRRDSDNSLGWRKSEFEMVKGELLPIPYFNGHRRKMPVVLLRHKATGVKAWFGNFHNPADTRRFHRQQRWRTRATQIEAAMVNRLSPSGLPVFVTGDMNERKEFFCRFTAAAPSMTAARGGSNGPGGCQPGRPRVIDWIFGSRGVSWNGYREDRSRLVKVTTDHPVISVRATVDTGVFPRSDD